MTSGRKCVYKMHIFFFGAALLTKYTGDQVEKILMGWARSTHREEVRCIQGFGEETRGKENTRPRSRWENNIKMGFKDVG
jgi:hypothetical protein